MDTSTTNFVICFNDELAAKLPCLLFLQLVLYMLILSSIKRGLAILKVLKTFLL